VVEIEPSLVLHHQLDEMVELLVSTILLHYDDVDEVTVFDELVVRDVLDELVLLVLVEVEVEQNQIEMDIADVFDEMVETDAYDIDEVVDETENVVHNDENENVDDEIDALQTGNDVTPLTVVVEDDEVDVPTQTPANTDETELVEL